MKNICIEENGLSAITDEVHDHTFDIDDLEKQRGLPCVTFLLASETSNGIPVKKLLVRNVKEFKYKDEEKTGYYNVNDLVYFEDERRLVVAVDLIHGIEFWVTALEVEVQSIPE